MGFTSSDFKNFANMVQAALEDFFPGVLVVDGEEYGCTCYGITRSGSHEAGGFIESLPSMIRVRKEIISESPVVGDMVQLNGVEVRVVSTDERVWEGSWCLRVEGAV
ncbi:MAG: hypothetical protein ACSHX0_06860 [Akkermansiaceae bacterium]